MNNEQQSSYNMSQNGQQITTVKRGQQIHMKQKVISHVKRFIQTATTKQTSYHQVRVIIQF